MDSPPLKAILNNIPALLAAMDLPPELVGKVAVAVVAMNEVLSGLDFKDMFPPEPPHGT